MIPVLTPEQMRAADDAAVSEAGGGDLFIRRAGHAVARVAKEMMGGAYGRRVVVVVGKGNNGNDGRVAGGWLAQWGAHVSYVDAADAGSTFIDPRKADLVVDAAYGIGFRGTWNPPIVFDVPVLAVDLPSGLDSLHGGVAGGVLPADRTVTFAAVKTGMLFGDGPALCGEIDVVDVGIDPVHDVDTWLVDAHDVASWLPRRERTAHKWDSAVRVVAGSAGMGGAASLASAASMRAGAGMVRLSWRTGHESFAPPTEVVGTPLPVDGWAAFVAHDIVRFGALVIGPGLGRGDDVAVEVRETLAACDVPAVVDGDGIVGAVDPNGGWSVLQQRAGDTVLTPHDGEFGALGGDTTDPDRIAATRRLAHDTGCVVLRKGPTTVVSDPQGVVYLSVAGDERLATAGSGDVLAGIIGAFIARGLPPLEAAAAGAQIHGLAGSRCPAEGTIARDVLSAVSDVLSEACADVR